MNHNLVFIKSGDSIQLVHHNMELVNYYIESLDSTNKNNFTISVTTLIDNIDYLKQCIIDIDKFLISKFKFNTFSKFVDIELYNQLVLNEIHKVWVNFQLEKASIITLLHKVDDELVKKFRDINNILHNIESVKFKLVNFDSHNIWSCKNIFGTDIIDFNNYNVKIEFNDLGRITYDKWRNHDTNINDSDTSDWETLGGELILRTNKPFETDAPKIYKTFCKNNNIPIIGHTVGLGNFVQSVEVVQEILYKNLKTGCTNLKLIV